MFKINGKDYTCSLEFTLDVLGGKWKSLILWYLNQEIHRFGELRRKLCGISKKVLTEQLRDMEKNGLISRKVYAEVPPRVEYSITNKGKSLIPILECMVNWAEDNFPKTRQCSLEKKNQVVIEHYEI